MKIEFLAYKGSNERLLFERVYNVDEIAVVWPDSSQFYTNVFDVGSEFIRLSGIPANYSVFELMPNDLLVLITSQTLYNVATASLDGKIARNFRLSSTIDLSNAGSGYLDVVEQLMLIRNDLEQLL